MAPPEYWRGAGFSSRRPRRQMTATVLERVPLNPQLLASLRQRLGDRLSTSAAVCEQHGKDKSYHAPHAPDAVAFAHSTEEVADDRPALRRVQDAGHRLRHRHLARRPCRGAEGRRLHRPVADEPGAARSTPRISTPPSRPASRASSSTNTCATPGCSSRSIPAPTPRSAAWRRRAPRAPTRCATARCARTCWR